METTTNGGLRLTPAQAKIEMDRLREIFNFLPDSAELFTEWTRIIDVWRLKNRAPRARMIAAMQVRGISNLLTFNTTYFVGYSNIVVLHPVAV